ncbi:hypothetical protein [Bombiscardovia coagulans]|uniref:Uncharacterized protein n=1 Tax=Bombiscardovia coagulans TaxID=686666 RepID=A0A261ESI2_9BIFI|nr:hypothetical protein [Bombiscardovia coagulans]OZG49814.1 hypothetical protein BOCO_0331 [Bombiscardovia coagulans]
MTTTEDTVNTNEFLRLLYDMQDIRDRVVSFPMTLRDDEYPYITVEDADKLGHDKEPIEHVPGVPLYPADVTVTLLPIQGESPKTVFTIKHDAQTVCAPDSLGAYGPEGAIQKIITALLDGTYQYAGVRDMEFTCISLVALGLPDLIAYPQEHHSYKVYADCGADDTYDMRMYLQLTIGGYHMSDDRTTSLVSEAERALERAASLPQTEKMPSEQEILAELPASDGVTYTIEKVWRICDSLYAIFDGIYEDRMHAWCVMAKRTKGSFTHTKYYTLIHSYAGAGGGDDAACFDRRWTISSRLSVERVMSLYPLLRAEVAITQTKDKRESI